MEKWKNGEIKRSMLDGWIERSVGRWIFCVASFLFYKLPHPPHNTLTTQYISICYYIPFCAYTNHIWSLHLDTHALIHHAFHTFQDGRCAPRDCKLLAVFCHFFHLHFHTLWHFEQQGLLWFTLATSSWVHVLYHAHWQLPFLTYRPIRLMPCSLQVM